jgi:hypothetical protein
MKRSERGARHRGKRSDQASRTCRAEFCGGWFGSPADRVESRGRQAQLSQVWPGGSGRRPNFWEPNPPESSGLRGEGSTPVPLPPPAYRGGRRKDTATGHGSHRHQRVRSAGADFQHCGNAASLCRKHRVNPNCFFGHLSSQRKCIAKGRVSSGSKASRTSGIVKVCGWRPHDGGGADTGAGVRKPPREESAGGVTKLRVGHYGDLDAGGLLPRCVDRFSGKQSTGWLALSGSRDRQTGVAQQRSNDRTAVPGCARATLIIAGQEVAIQKGQAGMSPRSYADHDVPILITAVDAAGR